MRRDFIDGVEPHSVRLPGEARTIAKRDADRAKGKYRYFPTAPSTAGSGPVDKDGPAWTIYKAQLARGEGEQEDYAGMLRIASKVGAE